MTESSLTSPPTLRALALDAAAVALNTGRYWLPAEAQAAVVDAVTAVYEADLEARLERVLDNADHHNRAAAHAHDEGVPELVHVQSGIAGGLHIAAADIARGRPDLVARLRQRIDQDSTPSHDDKQGPK